MRRDKKNQKPDKNVSKRDKRKYIEYRQRFKKGDPLPSFSDEVRLNKFISNAGICSRREADVLIAAGVVMVNDKVITELGYKVKPADEVKYDGEEVEIDLSFNVMREFVYCSLEIFKISYIRKGNSFTQCGNKLFKMVFAVKITSSKAFICVSGQVHK